MLRIDPNVMIHRLNVDPNYKVIQQKRKIFIHERYEAMITKVDMLLKVSFIKNIDYLT